MVGIPKMTALPGSYSSPDYSNSAGNPVQKAVIVASTGLVGPMRLHVHTMAGIMHVTIISDGS